MKRPHENKGARGRISQTHVDFVICDAKMMEALVESPEMDYSMTGGGEWSARIKEYISMYRQSRDSFLAREKRAEMLWEAAHLLPRQDPRAATMLWQAGMWIADQDPKAADRYYQELVTRCGQTPLGQLADEKRWFSVWLQEWRSNGLVLSGMCYDPERDVLSTWRHPYSTTRREGHSMAVLFLIVAGMRDLPNVTGLANIPAMTACFLVGMRYTDA